MSYYKPTATTYFCYLLVTFSVAMGCKATGTDATPSEGDAVAEDVAANPLEMDVEYNIPSDTSRTSLITAFSYQFGSTSTSNVTIEFFDQSPPVTETVDSTDDSSGCKFITTNYGTNVGSPIFADAGTISVFGGQPDVELMFLDGTYGAYASGDSALFTGGETLRFTGTGGKMIPPFSIELNAPEAVVVSTPTFLPGNTLTVRRDATFELQWSGGLADTEVRLSLVSKLSATETVRIDCAWPVAAGRASIPEAMMANMISGQSSLTVKTVARAATLVDDWGPVECIAVTPAINPDGVPLDLDVELN